LAGIAVPGCAALRIVAQAPTVKHLTTGALPRRPDHALNPQLSLRPPPVRAFRHILPDAGLVAHSIRNPLGRRSHLAGLTGRPDVG